MSEAAAVVMVLVVAVVVAPPPPPPPGPPLRLGGTAPSPGSLPSLQTTLPSVPGTAPFRLAAAVRAGKAALGPASRARGMLGGAGAGAGHAGKAAVPGPGGRGACREGWSGRAVPRLVI